MIGNEDPNVSTPDQLPDLELGISHFYAEQFSFRVACDSASVLFESTITGLPPSRPEDKLARDVEVVAVHRPMTSPIAGRCVCEDAG